jgi:hypothetical protein
MNELLTLDLELTNQGYKNCAVNSGQEAIIERAAQTTQTHTEHRHATHLFFFLDDIDCCIYVLSLLIA